MNFNKTGLPSSNTSYKIGHICTFLAPSSSPHNSVIVKKRITPPIKRARPPLFVGVRWCSF